MDMGLIYYQLALPSDLSLDDSVDERIINSVSTPEGRQSTEDNTVEDLNVQFPTLYTTPDYFANYYAPPDRTPALTFSSLQVMDTASSKIFVKPIQAQTQNVFMGSQCPAQPNSRDFMPLYDSPAASDCSNCLSATESPMQSAPPNDICQSPSSSSRTPSSDLRHQRLAPPPSSTELDSVQGQSPGGPGIPTNTSRRISKRPTAPAITHTLVEASKKTCSWHGCNKTFTRQEHLKRHFRTHSKGREDGVKCVFCEKPKWFTRGDNYKAHLKLHMNLKASGKHTPYHDGAEAAYSALKSKPRTKTAGFPDANSKS